MNSLLKEKIDVVFYRSGTGHEPVREWLKSLPRRDKKVIGEDVKTVQFGWPLGMPLVRYLGSGLWEVRSFLGGKRITRVIFFMHEDAMILLHGFIKKSQKMPSSEFDLALRRKKEVEQE